MVVTWNPTDKGSSVTLTNGNLSATAILQTRNVKSTEPKTSGKWYCEVKLDASANSMVGIAPSNANMNGNLASTTGFCVYYSTGTKIIEGSNTAYGASYTTGDTIGVFVDFDAKQITFYKNGISQGIAWSGFSHMSDFVIVVSSGTLSNNTNVTANFGATPFAFTPDPLSLPSGVFSYDGSQQLSAMNKSVIKDNEAYKTYVQGNSEVPSENIIPVMTSNTAPAPYVASESTQYGGYVAYNAFNRIFNGTSRWIAGAGVPQWCQIDLNTPKKAFSYRLSAGNISQQPSSWILQGSNNNSDWTDLHTVNDKPLDVDTWTDFPIPVPNEYRYYRAYITQANTGGAPSAGALPSLSGFALQTEYIPAGISRWDNVSSTLPTEQQFRDRGMDSLDILNRKVTTLSPKTMSDESQILLEGQGKVFGYSIDLKKYLDIRTITAKGVK